MWIVAIAWMYVAVMMSLAEATSPQGTALGAVITLLFYGVGPAALVMYVLRTPARRRARREREAREHAEWMVNQADSAQADGRGLPAGDAIAPERKEP